MNPVAAILLAAVSLCAQDGPVKSPVKADETVTFFTSAAWPGSSPGEWQAEVRGITFEKEPRPLLAAALRRALGVNPASLGPAERALMHERILLFLADNERGKSIPVRLCGDLHLLRRSAPNGHFRGSVSFKSVAPLPVTVEAILREGDRREFAGTILPMPDTSLPMVVSDVDDTIKLTSVRDRAAAIRNTFCTPFTEVPAMAERYAAWSAQGADFHYVSGSPWQLYTPLDQFTHAAGFPAGAWHLKHLRLADPDTVLAFLGPQQEYKLSVIRPLFEKWKNRHFVLVGDTGEQDPEIYATLAREFGERVSRILLRNVSGETRDNERLTQAFKDIPSTQWQLFNTAEELPVRL